MAKDKNKTKEKEQKGKRVTKAKTNNKSINDIQIVGDNVLYNNGIITAYYILPLVNYSTISDSGKANNIEDLYGLISNLASQVPDVTFTIERVKKVIRAKDVRDNLVQTIEMYRHDFEMPEVFTRRIEDDEQVFCLLGVELKINNVTEVADLTLGETVKQLFKSYVNKFALNSSCNPEQILKVEKVIYNTVRYKCARASKELVFYNFVSKIYPQYVISYDKLSYINENTFSSIMGTLTQSVTDNFDHFTLSNEGLQLFDFEDFDTSYGSILNVRSFPEKIPETNFDIDFEIEGCALHTVTTIKCIKKEDAILKLKRTRASDRYETNQAMNAGAEMEQVEQTLNNIEIATYAITQIEQGDILCNFSTIFLLLADDLHSLRAGIAQLMSQCKDRNILLSKSITQALDYLNYYVNNKPRKYDHMTSIKFPLCFQLNSGALVGDTDDKDEAKIGFQPAIGEDDF